MPRHILDLIAKVTCVSVEIVASVRAPLQYES